MRGRMRGGGGPRRSSVEVGPLRLRVLRLKTSHSAHSSLSKLLSLEQINSPPEDMFSRSRTARTNTKLYGIDMLVLYLSPKSLLYIIARQLQNSPFLYI